MKILLLAGGWSPEREISIRGAMEIEAALRRMGNSTETLDPIKDLPLIIREGAKSDFVFINMHGAPGEDGLIQAILEKIPAPYNGSDSAVSIIALNKYVSKIYYKDAGLPVCPDLFVAGGEEALSLPFAYPAIIKPNAGGSSIRLRKLAGEKDLEQARADLMGEAGGEYLIEPMIEGIEITCPVMGNAGGECRAMPTILIQPAAGGIFDFYAKYTDNAAREICPAPVEARLNDRIQGLAEAAHKALGLSGVSRSDFMVDGEENIYILETNTLPGMTPNSLLPKSAKAMGMSFEDLLSRIIELGLEKFAAERKAK